jgi:hypothetical protein
MWKPDAIIEITGFIFHIRLWKGLWKSKTFCAKLFFRPHFHNFHSQT